MTLYRDLVGRLLTDTEYHRAVRYVLATHKYPTFPVPAQLLETAIQTRRERAAEDASLAFDLVTEGTVHKLLHTQSREQRVCDCTRDRYELALLRERFGNVVAEALVEAGGVEVLDGMRPSDEPFVRKRFVEAYQERAVSRPQEALPQAIRRLALEGARRPEIAAPGATEADRELSPEEARKLIEQIRAAIAPEALSPEDFERRRAELETQRAEIANQEASNGV